MTNSCRLSMCGHKFDPVEKGHLMPVQTSASFSLGETIVISMLSAIVPAVATACGSYVLARNRDWIELQQWLRQARSLTEGQITTLRQTYITPLRYWASLLRKRIQELQAKEKSGTYAEVSSWFQKVKSHADGNERRNDFPFWSAYEGIFAITTLYWTVSYFLAARAVRYGSPFQGNRRKIRPAASKPTIYCE